MEQTQPISLRVGANFNQGKVRTENQDRIGRFESSFGQVFIVADGMGGHEGGATAAQMLIDGLERHLRQVPPGTTTESALQAAASRANADIYQRANSGDPKTAQMGATSVLALVRGNQVTIAHAGDSRAYLLRGGELSRLTRDHTVVQRMLDHNMLSPEEARDHPDASVVTRAFGQKPDVELEVSAPFELQPGDRLLLCSDGLCGYVDDERIRQVLARGGDAQAVADALIGLALDAGGEDNVSVQILAAEGAGGRRSAGLPPAAPAPRRGPSWIFVILLLLAAFLLGLLLSRFWDQWKGKKASIAETSPGTQNISLNLMNNDKKVIRRLLSHLRGLAYRGAGDGFEAGRIYFRENANQKAEDIFDKLRSARPGMPSYQTEPWPDNLTPELEEKMRDADVLIIWNEGEPESSETSSTPNSLSSANTPAPAETSPPAETPPLVGPPAPVIKPGRETLAAGGEPAAAATPGTIDIHPTNLTEDVEVLRNLLSSQLGIATRTATDGFEAGRVYYRKKDFKPKAQDVVDQLNRRAGKSQYQSAPWPDKHQGEMPGINVVVVVPHKGKGNS
ncbi:MAG TPA: protein phosphatase 2C domain-containing protein [Thermoanaerobaculia bacterium]|nr:protein phosphatase 2C domain-containing protein [Thermoanaerobaculia bacterium]